MRRDWGVVSHAATSSTKLVFKSSRSLSNNTRSGFVWDWVQFCWYVGKCSPDNNNIYSYKESSHLTKSSQAENDSFGNNKREKYFLIEHIKQNNERIGEKWDSLSFSLHSLMMMMISLAFLTTSGAVVEDCFHVLDLFFFTSITLCPGFSSLWPLTLTQLRATLTITMRDLKYSKDQLDECLMKNNTHTYFNMLVYRVSTRPGTFFSGAASARRLCLHGMHSGATLSVGGHMRFSGSSRQ